MDFTDFKHDDFVSVRRDDRHGGFEEVKHKDAKVMPDLRFFRKSVTPFNHAEFEDMMKLQDAVMKEGASGAVYPIYEHDGRKWVLMSVPQEHYAATGLGV